MDILENIGLKKESNTHVIALAGNPNTGKSTLFNKLTGMHQHTGNWPGKTVGVASGKYKFHNENYNIVDLPGTYSLLSSSQEEKIAADFIVSKKAECTIVVCDASQLERNLVLVQQVLELTDKVIVCVNLMDEAEKKSIKIDDYKLQKLLGVPVVKTAVGIGKGLEELKNVIEKVINGNIVSKPKKIILDNDEINIKKLFGESKSDSDEIASDFVRNAERIASQVVHKEEITAYEKRQQKIDNIVMGKGGILVMITLLFAVFWLTIEGANYPSSFLEKLFSRFGNVLWNLSDTISLPWYISEPLLNGVYAITTKVISVMLPPMVIFFPCFSLLEDFGYLPRVAFRLDNAMCKCGTCGKQCLTMCMGFGCNATGVTGARIIDSPRERLIAILTNSLVPCNGRFPTLILLITIFFSRGGFFGSIISALILTLLVIIGISATMIVSKILNKTILKGIPSSFVLELPPYRKPQFLKVIVNSIVDKTLKIAGRAILVAAPAGLIIWLLVNISYDGVSLAMWIANFLNPIGVILGLNGVILTAFILGLPANEIVIPIILMLLTSTGVLGNIEDTASVGEILISAGWTCKTAICTMIFTLFHWPCLTTIITIKKETGSWKWAGVAILIPITLGFILCASINFVIRIYIKNLILWLI